jgi:hypothetical protein
VAALLHLVYLRDRSEQHGRGGPRPRR